MRFCIPESQINPAIHEIFSGPYGSEGECLGGCDSSSSSSTSSSSSSSSGPCELSSGSIQPPLITKGTNFNDISVCNINEYNVYVELEYSEDNGATWSYWGLYGPVFSKDTPPVTARPGFAKIRGRCRKLDDSSSLSGPYSAWSYEYAYPNLCALQPPMMFSEGGAFNVNDYDVMAFLETYLDPLNIWFETDHFRIPANSIATTIGIIGTKPQFVRMRCTKADGPGDSVSAWWSNDYAYPSQNILPPVLQDSGFQQKSVFNPNNYEVAAFVQYSQDGGATWEFGGIISTIAANSTETIVWAGDLLPRVRFAGTGDGDSVSAWSS